MSTIETVFWSTFHSFIQRYYFRHNVLMENEQLQNFKYSCGTTLSNQHFVEQHLKSSNPFLFLKMYGFTKAGGGFWGGGWCFF